MINKKKAKKDLNKKDAFNKNAQEQDLKSKKREQNDKKR